MTTSFKILILSAVLLNVGGCAKNRTRASGNSSVTSESFASSFWNAITPSSGDEDIWEQGYGFNNPNADRIKAELRQ